MLELDGLEENQEEDSIITLDSCVMFDQIGIGLCIGVAIGLALDYEKKK